MQAEQAHQIQQQVEEQVQAYLKDAQSKSRKTLQRLQAIEQNCQKQQQHAGMSQPEEWWRRQMKEQFGQLHATIEAGQNKVLRRVQRLERNQREVKLPKPKSSHGSGNSTAQEDDASNVYDSDSSATDSDSSGVVALHSAGSASGSSLTAGDHAASSQAADDHTKAMQQVAAAEAKEPTMMEATTKEPGMVAATAEEPTMMTATTKKPTEMAAATEEAAFAHHQTVMATTTEEAAVADQKMAATTEEAAAADQQTMVAPTTVIPVMEATTVIPVVGAVAPTAVTPVVAAVGGADVTTASAGGASMIAATTAGDADLATATERRIAILEKAVQSLHNQIREVRAGSLPAPRAGKARGNRGTVHNDQQSSSDGEETAHNRPQYQPQKRHDANSGKVSELRMKSLSEWDRIERLFWEKIKQITAERAQQMEVKLEKIRSGEPDMFKNQEFRANAAREKWMRQHYVADRQTPYNYDLIQEELAEALQQEKEYEKCNYRRTACKALDNLIKKYNVVWRFETKQEYGQPQESYVETGNCKKWIFDQFGVVSETYNLLVDPGRFWSYDLHRSKVYGERPL